MLLPRARLELYPRLRTPDAHLGVLFEPPASAVATGLEAASAGGDLSKALLDSTVGEVRDSLRRRLRFDGPVVMTGHQAEFFHAGVYEKSSATEALGARVGGSAVFLTVDSDLAKTKQLLVPYAEGSIARRAPVTLPGWDTSLPMESQPALNPQAWREVFERARARLADTPSSLLGRYSDAWMAGIEQGDACDAVVRGRAAVEEALGLSALRDVRMSQLCATPEFRGFVAHLILQADRFASDYNSAQASYRVRRRVRNPARPVPSLRRLDGRCEAPFWVYRAGEARRALFVERVAACIKFYAEGELIGEQSTASLSSLRDAENPMCIEADGWRVRPRALTLSAFLRLFVADVFIHGIGGAKYDEMTEEFVQRFFGIQLGPMVCVTATLRMPLPHSGVSLDTIRSAQHALRDVRYNPQRHFDELPQDMLYRRAKLIDEWAVLRKERRDDHEARRRNYSELRETRRALLSEGADQVALMEERFLEAVAAGQRDAVALDREYFFAFHSADVLGELVDRVRDLARS